MLVKDLRFFSSLRQGENNAPVFKADRKFRSGGAGSGDTEVGGIAEEDMLRHLSDSFFRVTMLGVNFSDIDSERVDLSMLLICYHAAGKDLRSTGDLGERGGDESAGDAFGDRQPQPFFLSILNNFLREIQQRLRKHEEKLDKMIAPHVLLLGVSKSASDAG